jgi:hypothetical protein
MQRCRKRISFGNLTATVSTFYWAGRPISPTTSDKLSSQSGNRRSAASGRLAAEQSSVQRQSSWLQRICRQCAPLLLTLRHSSLTGTKRAARRTLSNTQSGQVEVTFLGTADSGFVRATRTRKRDVTIWNRSKTGCPHPRGCVETTLGCPLPPACSLRWPCKHEQRRYKRDNECGYSFDHAFPPHDFDDITNMNFPLAAYLRGTVPRGSQRTVTRVRPARLHGPATSVSSWYRLA